MVSICAFTLKHSPIWPFGRTALRRHHCHLVPLAVPHLFIRFRAVAPFSHAHSARRWLRTTVSESIAVADIPRATDWATLFASCTTFCCLAQPNLKQRRQLVNAGARLALAHCSATLAHSPFADSIAGLSVPYPTKTNGILLPLSTKSASLRSGLKF